MSSVSHSVWLLLIAVSAPTGGWAQGLSVEVASGPMIYDPGSTNVGTNNVMSTLRDDARRDAWVYGTAAAPLRAGDPAQVLRARRQEDGGVVIRVSASEARGSELSIAGDFNTWRPMPMRREGNVWVIRLPLSPGVYHYAFRSASGDWFVPASVAGRRADGMGGYHAVLVVS